MNDPDLNIPMGGFIPCSMTDYPSHISCIVFTTGCNMRCHYCHNTNLLRERNCDSNDVFYMNQVKDHVKKHRMMLDGVVIIGGEPTIHEDLISLISWIKTIGLNVKLDTNGTNFNMVNTLVTDGLVDYVAMDLKASLSYESYCLVVGRTFRKELFDNVLRTKGLLEKGAVDYEFRTTLSDRLHKDDLLRLAGQKEGRWFLQQVEGQSSCWSFTQEELNVLNEKYKGYISYR
ncbi:anaerobic ribonucleoside-triphosphate reductase activating protein [Halosquirtibacter xylanolyticus]|uniref:anaerobic ribonucleoside-triphosphate reductase activating protein n=1 Tax=Halosquirtibacter xylanolyticus TaxID=3374599 RepID=UPI003747CAA9|nr:anaerobic ribonucleoside-triphosphate reductase activating protein [Prolixibacteraceae bacterium]